MSGWCEVFRAVAEFFGFINRRTDLKNKPSVVAAQEAQNQINKRNEIEKTVEKKDTSATQAGIAE